MYLTQFFAAFYVFLPVDTQCEAKYIDQAWEIIACWNGCPDIKTKTLVLDLNEFIFVHPPEMTVVVCQNAIFPRIYSTCWLTANITRFKACHYEITVSATVKGPLEEEGPYQTSTAQDGSVPWSRQILPNETIYFLCHDISCLIVASITIPQSPFTLHTRASGVCRRSRMQS